MSSEQALTEPMPVATPSAARAFMAILADRINTLDRIGPLDLIDPF